MQIIYGSMRHDLTGRKRKPRKVSKKKYTPPKFQELVLKKSTLQIKYEEEMKKYSSNNSLTTPNSCGLIESKKYTGNVVIGIATMHKSNAVPVTSSKHAEEISRMAK
jgi:hypothetical protein